MVADHQGNPANAQNQALRLITQEKVVALVGCYFSNVTATLIGCAGIGIGSEWI